MRLVEDLRVGGGERGPSLGLVDDVVPTSTGGILIVDSYGPALLRVEGDGSVWDTIGRPGRGPGEYEQISGVIEMPGGDVVVRDVNRAVIRYSAEGDLMGEWPIRLPLGGGSPIAAEGEDGVVVATILGSVRDWRHAFVRLSLSTGIADTLFAPPPTQVGMYAVAFSPREYTMWHPDGFIIVATSSDYTLRIIDRPTRSAAERVVRLDFDPLGVAVGEWEAWTDLNEIRRRRGMRNPDALPEIPRTKPAFKDVVVARSGEIWVHRHTTAEEAPSEGDVIAASAIPWHETALFDVLHTDGMRIARVAGPSRFELRAASNDTVWGVAYGDFDQEYVVRMHASPSGG